MARSSSVEANVLDIIYREGQSDVERWISIVHYIQNIWRMWEPNINHLSEMLYSSNDNKEIHRYDRFHNDASKYYIFNKKKSHSWNIESEYIKAIIWKLITL